MLNIVEVWLPVDAYFSFKKLITIKNLVTCKFFAIMTGLDFSGLFILPEWP